MTTEQCEALLARLNADTTMSEATKNALWYSAAKEYAKANPATAPTLTERRKAARARRVRRAVQKADPNALCNSTVNPLEVLGM